MSTADAPLQRHSFKGLARRGWKLLNPDYNIFRPGYWFGQVDSRPLSLFRIFFALLLFKDSLYRIAMSRWFYSDQGIAPRSAFLDGLLRSNRFSLMDAMPYHWMAVAFFAIWSLVTLSLLVGYRTKLMSILNLLIIISYHERNLYVLNGADGVMRILSFWAVFLPLGHYYSIDALRRRMKRYRISHQPADLRVSEQRPTAFAFPLRMIQLQVAMVYLFTAWLKLPGIPTPWSNGDAIFYALQVTSLTLPTGDLLLAVGPMWLLRFITMLTIITEIVFLFFVFAPIGQPSLRVAALTMGAMIHTGIALTMSIANFSAVMMISYLLFFEGKWLSWLEQRLRSSATKGSTMSIPPPAQNSPSWLLLMVTRADEVSVDWQAAVGSGNYDDWALVDGGGRSLSGAAACEMSVSPMQLSRLWRWTMRWGWFSRRARRAVSWLVGRAILPNVGAAQGAAHLHDDDTGAPLPDDVPRLPLALRLSAKTVGTLAIAGLMGSVIWWNLSAVIWKGENIVPPVANVPRTAVQYSALYQEWHMFSPFPRDTDGWIVIPGIFEDGSSFDLRTGRAVSDEQPQWLIGPGLLWKKYEASLNEFDLEPLLRSWADYYCDVYNNQEQLPAGQRLATLEIRYIYRRSHLPGEPINPLQEYQMWRHWCFPEYAY